MAIIRERVKLEVLVCAQGAFADDPAQQEQMKNILDEFDIKVRFTVQPEEDPCRMAHLRQSAALLKPESDYYMFVDDDLEFVPGVGKPGSAAKYLAAFDYMEANPKCGSLGQYGEFGSISYGHDIRPDPIGKIAATAKGLMLRNVWAGHIFPPEVLEMGGPYEEMAAIIHLNLNGYYYAKQFKVPSKYKRPSTKVTTAHIPGDNNLHNAELGAANIQAWIRRVCRKPYYLYGDSILNLGFGFKPKGK